MKSKYKKGLYECNKKRKLIRKINKFRNKKKNCEEGWCHVT